MLRFLRFFCFALLLAAAAARAEEGARPEPLNPSTISDLSLDELFDKLPAESGSRAGKLIEAEILKRLQMSGSDTADLLMAWSVEAMEEKDFPLALDLLDHIIMLEPGFAEAWNKRATVYFMMDDYGSSLSDIRQTLAIEPRHFGALSGLGMILSSMDRKEEAIRAFRRALEINPQLTRVKESLERLEKETSGESI